MGQRNKKVRTKKESKEEGRKNERKGKKAEKKERKNEKKAEKKERIRKERNESARITYLTRVRFARPSAHRPYWVRSRRCRSFDNRSSTVGDGNATQHGGAIVKPTPYMYARVTAMQHNTAVQLLSQTPYMYTESETTAHSESTEVTRAHTTHLLIAYAHMYSSIAIKHGEG